METTTPTTMDIDVKFPLKPGATAAEITFRPGQKITAEGGAMIAMSTSLSMTTSTQQKKIGWYFERIETLDFR
ncbi:MAG: hypothetical protein RL264_1833 [Bacteroidota bacterium]|jgi:uncharacterized protein (AIM24 family)